MRRAFLIELAVFRDYGKQLVGLGLLVAILVGFGMRTVIAAPAILTVMFFMMGAMGAAAYDEQNGWGRFRLAMPLSRRDVVIGRYAAIATLGLGGMIVGLVAAFLVGGLASANVFPGELSDELALDSGLVRGMAFATAFCLLIGATVVAVITPIYFKLGQTKATQILPTVIVLLFVLPVVFLANSGLLDGGVPGLGVVVSLLEFLDAPFGMAIGCAALVVLSTVILGISAAISLKLYESREM